MTDTIPSCALSTESLTHKQKRCWTVSALRTVHGVLDYLREGHIWDCKFSTTYKLNKYRDSPQHPMYLELVPEAKDFTYIITDGKYVYREKYPRDIVAPIEIDIKNFMNFCKSHDLWDTYREKWRVNNG